MLKQNAFRYFKTLPEIIRLAVKMYVRFALLLRNVGDLLHERGIDICHETARNWWNRFGPLFAREIRKKRLHPSLNHSNWRWHMDKVVVKINGETHYLWRAVDHEGDVREACISRWRDCKAALKFLKKITKRYARPHEIDTDRLKPYPAAMKTIGNDEVQEVGRWSNNRCGNCHLSFRRRMQAMLNFRR
nr:IS6 family transposase [Sneathiella chungangensis]